MKHDVLHAIAHNFADSLGSYPGFLVGYYGADPYAAARDLPGGALHVDVLGQGAQPGCEETMAGKVAAYRQVFSDFCERHGATAAEFRAFEITYFAAPAAGAGTFRVTIEDSAGRRSSRDYEGAPGRSVTVLDAEGRRRRVRKPKDGG